MATPARARATTPRPVASARRRALAGKAAFYAIRGLELLATWLPERWLGTAAACIGDAAFFVIRWRRRVAGARVTRAWPHLSQAQRHQLVRASYAHLALALLWALRLPRLLDREGADALVRRVEIDDATRPQLAQLSQQLEAGGGSAIMTSGHVGVWELLPALLGSSLLPRHTQWIVYRPLHNEPVNALLETLRAGENRHLVADKHCFRALQHALACGDAQRPSLVGLVADQRSSNPHARCAVRFLGQQTLLPTGAARLHLATRSPLWFAALVVNHHGTEEKPFKLVLRAIAPDDPQGDESHELRLTQAYAAALEETVRAYRAQYLWIHDLWTERAQQLIAE